MFPCSQTKSASPQLPPRQTETRWTWRPSASSPRSSLLPSPVSLTLPKNCPCSPRWVVESVWKHCYIHQTSPGSNRGCVWFSRSICLVELAVRFEKDHNSVWGMSHRQFLTVYCTNEQIYWVKMEQILQLLNIFSARQILLHNSTHIVSRENVYVWDRLSDGPLVTISFCFLPSLN